MTNVYTTSLWQFLGMTLAGALLIELLSSCVAPKPKTPPAAVQDKAFPEVGMADGWLTVGGDKFLVVGIGYEIGGRPGELPWAHQFQPEVLRADFKRIKEAGFNTIRTWSPMTDQELEVAAEFGLWVIQGLWIDPAANFNDPKFRAEIYAYMERELSRLSKHPNILFYLLLNEPNGKAVYTAGVENINDFYRELLKVARRCDSKRLFSYANCVITDFLTPEMWDLASYNAYPYSPITVEKALGYRAYIELLKERFAASKPLIITEFGLSVSPRGDGRGYGGNTLEEQRDGVLRLWNDVLNAGGAGGCAFMWIDGWWKSKNEKVHDDNAEEWYGLLEADSEFLGRPRPVYYALQDYNRAIRTLPRDGQVFDRQMPVEIWSPDAQQVEARIDDGSWINLQKEGTWWWRGCLDTSSINEGQHYIWTRALDSNGRPQGVKYCIVSINRSGTNGAPPLRVRIRGVPTRVPVNQAIPVEVEVTDSQGNPIPSKLVQVDRFLHTDWNEFGIEVETDSRGVARCTLPALGKTGIISIAAGTVFENGFDRRRFGDYLHVELAAD